MVGVQSLPDSSVVINEINYNSADDFDPGDWVELYNPTGQPQNIGNWIFKDEDDDHIFLIPENTILVTGEYLVLNNDTTSFTTLFPDVNNFVGDLGFGFSGGGESLRLYNSDSILIDTVAYDDSDPWPEDPDGNGPTLELIHPSMDNAMVENWAASEGYGTPGSVNSVYLVNKYEPNIPEQFHVFNNYPNPFNPITTITYELPVNRHVNISIFNMLGRRVRTLVDQEMGAGTKSLIWNATNDYGKPVGAGVYLYQIQAGDFRQVKKMVLLK
jgi:hypothetical protein